VGIVELYLEDEKEFMCIRTEESHPRQMRERERERER
jgi:hypothetical protein